MVNSGPLAAEICWRVWGTPENFNGFRVLAALLHGTLVVRVSIDKWSRTKVWFMAGVEKHSGHATTLCVNRLYFGWNSYWKHFLNKSQEPCLSTDAIFDEVSQKILSKRAKTNIDSWVLLAPQCLNFRRNPQHCKILTWFLHASSAGWSSILGRTSEIF